MEKPKLASDRKLNVRLAPLFIMAVAAVTFFIVWEPTGIGRPDWISGSVPIVAGFGGVAAGFGTTALSILLSMLATAAGEKRFAELNRKRILERLIDFVCDQVLLSLLLTVSSLVLTSFRLGACDRFLISTWFGLVVAQVASMTIVVVALRQLIFDIAPRLSTVRYADKIRHDSKAVAESLGVPSTAAGESDPPN